MGESSEASVWSDDDDEEAEEEELDEILRARIWGLGLPLGERDSSRSRSLARRRRRMMLSATARETMARTPTTLPTAAANVVTLCFFFEASVASLPK